MKTIDKEKLTQVVEEALQGTDLFLVDVAIDHQEAVLEVTIDGMQGVTLDDCVMVNNAVLDAFDRDKEDYELTVGSYGISEPFKVRQHYVKNRGGEVEVLTTGGEKLKGVLGEAGDDAFTLTIPTKMKLEGKKRPEMVDVARELKYNEIKYIKNIIQI
jgi:ribosome maturation factor RimP